MSEFCYGFRAKNGQVTLSGGREISIGRRGWFGRLYQLLTREPRVFFVDQVCRVVLKEPGITRGYLRFELAEAKSGCCTVWLTNREMTQHARQVKRLVEERTASEASVLSTTA